MASQPPPGFPPGRLPVDLRPRRSILLPYNDLLIDQGLDQFLPILPGGFQLGIVLPYGMGPSEPKVFTMDAAGSLQVTMAGQTGVGAVELTGATGAIDTVAAFADPESGVVYARTMGPAQSYDGVSVLRVSRMASAFNLAAQSGLGAALTGQPGEWSISANPALGLVATVSRAAGAVGVRHILQGYQIVVSSQAAPIAGTLTINVRDGATGAGTILEGISLQIPAAIYAPFVIRASGLNVVGSAATAMTIESTAAYAGVGVSLALEGYDAA